MNKSTRSQKPTLLNSLKNNRSKILLNSVIGLLVIIIVVITISLIIKLQNLNEQKNIANQKSLNNRIIQVEVLNGCGISGAADNVTNYLREMNYDVVQMGNYRTFDIDESIIIDRKGDFKIAEDIADSLGIDKSNVIQQINKNYLLDVSIIVGKDYKHIAFKK